MIIDFFTYTEASTNGVFSIEQLIEAAKCAHLDGICVTDCGISSHAEKILRAAKIDEFFVGIGLEIQAKEGTLVAFPLEVDDDFIHEDWKRVLGELPDAQSVIDYFTHMGGVVIARNPYNQGEGLKDRLFLLHGLSGIDTLSHARRRIDNELAIEAQQALGVVGIGGSGVLNSLRDIGHTATISCAEITNQRELVDAIRGLNLWAISTRPLAEATPEGSRLLTSDDENSHEIRHNRNHNEHSERTRASHRTSSTTHHMHRESKLQKGHEDSKKRRPPSHK